MEENNFTYNTQHLPYLNTISHQVHLHREHKIWQIINSTV